MKEKQCPQCNRILPIVEFSKNKNLKDGLQCWCKQCHSEGNKRYRQTEKGKQCARRSVRKYRQSEKGKIKTKKYWKSKPGKLASRKTKLKQKFGITLEQYNKMFESQRGVCVICRKPETKRSNKGIGLRMLAVDHNHKTGQVRGLLCDKCNLMLGLANDNVTILLNAANYLEE